MRHISLLFLFWKHKERRIRSPFSLYLSPPEGRNRGFRREAVARQLLREHVLAGTNTYATVEEQLDVVFCMWPVSYQIVNMWWKESRWLVLLRTYCLKLLSLTDESHEEFESGETNTYPSDSSLAFSPNDLDLLHRQFMLWHDSVFKATEVCLYVLWSLVCYITPQFKPRLKVEDKPVSPKRRKR